MSKARRAPNMTNRWKKYGHTFMVTPGKTGFMAKLEQRGCFGNGATVDEAIDDCWRNFQEGKSHY